MSDNQLEIYIEHVLETANGKLPMQISLSVELGSILAVTGPSGSGKTTLLRQLAGLVSPISGRISHGNKTWLDTISKTNIPTQKRNIGFVFQDYALFPHFTVRENLAFGLEKGTKTDIIDELLNDIELVNLADRKPFQLSGGQQQRVALARALVRKPDLLLLDEPLSALDHAMRGNLQDLILKFHQEYGFTMIIVTHDLGEIFRLASQVAVLEDGKITQQGTPSEIYLPNENTKELILYGKVLTCTILLDHILVHALIQQNIQELKLPLHLASDMNPGRSFALGYAFGNAKIKMIDL